MHPSRTSNIRFLRLLGTILLIAIIVFYAIWRSLDYVHGPDITITGPANGALATSSVITISGRGYRTNDITLNGKAVTTDTQGNFEETILIFPGLNKILVAGTDQFGRHSSRELYIVGTTDFPSQRIIPAIVTVGNPATTSTSSGR